MVGLRPFESVDALVVAANASWYDCGPLDWLEAFSHHPRIGAKVAGKEAEEQSGALSASARIKEQLAAVNREYEAKFGHIYIVCATGKTAEEMLSLARARVANEPGVELRVAAEEQRQITEIRLRKLFE